MIVDEQYFGLDTIIPLDVEEPDTDSTNHEIEHMSMRILVPNLRHNEQKKE